MEKQEPKTSGAGAVQVFELTMDNAEDQDELNRRLRKPGEPDPRPPVQNGAEPGESSTGSPQSGSR